MLMKRRFVRVLLVLYTLFLTYLLFWDEVFYVNEHEMERDPTIMKTGANKRVGDTGNQCNGEEMGNNHFKTNREVFRCEITAVECTGCTINVNSADPDETAPAGAVSSGSSLFTGPPTDILITSYMRAGSSFLGRVLGFRSDTFYVYEPLFTLTKYGYLDEKKGDCQVFKLGCSSTNKHNTSLRILQQIYNCSFYQDPFVNAFKDNINAKLSGPQWMPYLDCFHRKYPHLCLKQVANEVCTGSKHKVTKVLRLSVENSELMLKSNPNLKVVYLVRDPRAIINSHLGTQWSFIKTTSNKSVEKGAKSICKRIRDDVLAARRLKSAYPDRFIVTQYEDFSNPLEKMKKLHKFLNLDLAKEVIKFLKFPKKSVNVSGDNIDSQGTGNLSRIVRSYQDMHEATRSINAQINETKEQAIKDIEMGKLGEINTQDPEIDDYSDYLDNLFKEAIALESSQLDGLDSEQNILLRTLKGGYHQIPSSHGFHPFMYRESLSWNQVQMIDQYCGRVYKLLGYVKFTSEQDLKDMSVPAVRDKLPFRI